MYFINLLSWSCSSTSSPQELINPAPTGRRPTTTHHRHRTPLTGEHGNYGNRKHLPNSNGTFFVELLVF